MTVCPRGPLGQALARQKQSPHSLSNGRAREGGQGRGEQEKGEKEEAEETVEGEGASEAMEEEDVEEEEVEEATERRQKLSALSVSGGRILAHRCSDAGLG